mgnify:CR=1 FL=1
MLFGLPWFAVIAIVAIGGGMIFSYKEKELSLEVAVKRYVEVFNKIVKNNTTPVPLILIYFYSGTTE